MQVKVFKQTGEEAGKITLADSVFKVPYNEALIHQVIVAYLANQRQGTKSTLTRTEVRGGGRKPWRQKGTGRARQGSIRSPQWTHGGVVFAPKPRDFSKKINKQMKTGAFVSALSSVAADKNLIVLENLEVEGKTKNMVEVLNAFKLDKRVTIVTEDVNENVVRASGNLDNVNVTTADLVNTYDIAAASKVVITKEAIKKIEEACK